MTALPQPDEATRRHWATRANGWLNSAYEGRLDDLRESLGIGFWTHWYSSTNGTPPIHLLVCHGKDPTVLDVLLKDGLDMSAVIRSGVPFVHALAARSEEAFMAWAPVLHKHGVDWEAQHPETGLNVIQALVQLHRIEAVEWLRSCGVQLPSTPSPIVLALNTNRRMIRTLEMLRNQGVQPDDSAREMFYPLAIAAGLPVASLPIYEAWGLPCPCSPECLKATLKSKKIREDWLSYLLVHGADPDAPCRDGCSARAFAHEGPASMPVHFRQAREPIALRFEHIVSQALKSILRESLDAAPATNPTRARL